ncbi:MAG: hypothetical protein M3Q69_08420 [Acidobacteriota bacterium]|nr:hypothetical protein [Acidobacteriota bacterium]
MAGLARAVAAIVVFSAGAISVAAGEPRVSLVPWRVIEPGAKIDAPLVLFWVPASSEELRRSELLTSDDLSLGSSRCVAMRVVRANDYARLAALGVEGNVPMAVLADRNGNVIGRVEADDGVLPIGEVEELVLDELDRREAEAEELLDRARARAAERDADAALRIYQAVAEAHCVCPRQARDARRAMRKLGRK